MTLPDIKEPHLRLQWAAAQKNCFGAADLYRFIGEREAESTVRSRFNGTRPMTKLAAKIYGQALGVPWLWLMGESAAEGSAGTITPAAPDEAALLVAIQEVETFLEDRKLTLPRQKKAQLVLAIYQLVVQRGSVDAVVLEQLVKMAS